MTTQNDQRQFEIEPHLARRSSPRAYSHTDTLTQEDLGPAFEAARWSASLGNTQPWSFVVGFRGDDVFETIVGTMAPGNAVWAQHVSALIANVTEVETEDGKERTHAVYDLGQSVAYFCAQATASGLLTHQMSGFDQEALRIALGLSPRFRVMSLLAVGTPGDIKDLPENLQEREVLPRVRRPLSEIVGGSVSYA